MSYFLYDIKNGDCPEVTLKFKSMVNGIKAEDHPNSTIFDGLDKSFGEFLCFNVLTFEEEICAFSGLYNNGTFPANTARALTRMYYSPKFRTKTLVPFKGEARNRISFSANWFLPYQVQFARNLGLDSVFFSVEHTRRRRSVKNFISWINDHPEACGSSSQWELLDGMYNTCRTEKDGKSIGINKSPTCWQNIAFLELKEDSELVLPRMSVEEWQKTYLEMWPTFPQKGNLSK